MSTAEEALEALGIRANEAIDADRNSRAVARSRSKDRRVCLCGHAVNRHLTTNGIVMCTPSRMVCPCKNIRAVLEAEDTRVFLRKTTGPGVEHALVKGMAALVIAGKQANWIDQPTCDRCSSQDGVSPVPVTSAKTVAYGEPTGYDALLCETCKEEL